ncbi:hypothetical protein AMTRI_Chr02g218280 [Amborella trichopoda]|uniref:F-box domain-containing protein n=1 Tax=Amborella trichopoda TaxID=13333 RepID=W1P742_AMBTC|nr:protein AUXIN SIGNALING F-BOX 3 [Amborella trichopoda]ERN03504.1 hypothetical protein AMTR_s00003p00270130 [Amborella trichopoda]|eukprot:XP_006841829.1 protein AUXIN SIGNALING F-BOX 3 [Amborella trichopoda]
MGLRSEKRRHEETHVSAFPDEVLENVLAFVKSHKDRSSASLVCKHWYEVERWSRNSVFIGNCYSLSPEILVKRFPNIRSITLKGKPRFYDFNLVPPDWGADVHSWLVVLAKAYPFLEELRLKRMTVEDESLEFLGQSFPNFKALSLVSCDGFSTDGLAAIASSCRNLEELDLQENGIKDYGGHWLSCFPESFTSMVALNFANLNSEVNFDALERLVTRCKSLKVLKLNRSVSLEQLQRLLVRAPQLTELGTGSFSQDLSLKQYSELEQAFSNCKSIHTLSGLWEVTSLYLPTIYPVCSNLKFLNLSYAGLRSPELARLLESCPNLQCLWVLDTVGDKGLEAVASSCPNLKELRVFPADPHDFDAGGVTEAGLVAVSRGCPTINYILYFCRRMTNEAVSTVAINCPGFTHFRLCILNPYQPDHLTHEPMDEAFGSVARYCPMLQRLSISGLLTDRAFELIGMHAKKLEALSVAFAGSTESGLEYVLRGCLKLRKLEVRDCSFGNASLMSGIERYESMRSLWMSACNVTMSACRCLARERPRLNVEVIREEEGDGTKAEKVYVYRSVAGPRKDCPPFVRTL